MRFSAPVQTGPGAHPASYTMGTGTFPGVKRPGRGYDHPLPSSAEVQKRVELYLYSPSGPSWPVLGWTLPIPLPLPLPKTRQTAQHYRTRRDFFQCQCLRITKRHTYQIYAPAHTAIRINDTGVAQAGDPWRDVAAGKLIRSQKFQRGWPTSTHRSAT